MRCPILHFFLLALGILFNFALNTSYKDNKFSKTLLEKGLKFILSKGVTFNLYLILLLAEVDFILEKQGCKGDALVTFSISYIEIVLVLLIKVVTLYMGAIIIQVGVPGP